MEGAEEFSRLMDKKELIKTKWAKEFKKGSPASYRQAIELAMMPNLLVRIYKTDEIGEWMWAIEPVILSGFWLDVKKTKKDCIALCKEMGWRYQPRKTK